MCMQISSEVGLKLRAMWAELPNMVVGIFAERDGFSVERVNSIIQVFAKYDAVEDKATVPAVARRYLAADSEHAQTLRVKVSAGLPLSHFRCLYMKARGHASGLVVSRRNEGGIDR